MHAYLEELKGKGITLGLETMEQLVELLGHPERAYPSVHIAGTNGKGSTAAFLAGILQAAGYTVGLYTSPHLIRFNERIRVNGKEIADEELVRLVESTRMKMRTLAPSYFEFTTALAFQHFKEQQVDIAIIETGLGGRLDATNVITPVLSIITNVSLDHMQHLGNTKVQIAQEKAGIIKHNVPVLTGETDPVLVTLFKNICAENSTELMEATAQLTGTSYQKYNKALAMTACALLTLQGWTISEDAITKGLTTQWPGRLHVIDNMLFDGAHNAAGMDALIASLPEKRDLLVLGISKEKDAEEMAKKITPLFKDVLITEGTSKPMLKETLLAVVQRYHPRARAATREEARAAIQKANGTVVVTGSLYLVGAMLELLGHPTSV
ncbi:MAG: bifunctional folylpolyglutamate synthase/dihydrofolate synthase [Candidatus Woesearchaeota archaeon]|nr:bifunctional folylpolyglutamate synthase/dihydrofolate synthase [Candidatus Woesearchaeota archaeon]